MNTLGDTSLTRLRLDIEVVDGRLLFAIETPVASTVPELAEALRWVADEMTTGSARRVV